MTLLPSLRALKKDRRLRTEFINYLAAGTAGRAWNSLVIHHRDGANIQSGAEFSYCGKNRGALGAV